MICERGDCRSFVFTHFRILVRKEIETKKDPPKHGLFYIQSKSVITFGFETSNRQKINENLLGLHSS